MPERLPYTNKIDWLTRGEYGVVNPDLIQLLFEYLCILQFDHLATLSRRGRSRGSGWFVDRQAAFEEYIYQASLSVIEDKMQLPEGVDTVFKPGVVIPTSFLKRDGSEYEGKLKLSKKKSVGRPHDVEVVFGWCVVQTWQLFGLEATTVSDERVRAADADFMDASEVSFRASPFVVFFLLCFTSLVGPKEKGLYLLKRLDGQPISRLSSIVLELLHKHSSMARRHVEFVKKMN